MEFEVVKREHLVAAIEEIATAGVPKGFHSSTYDVVYEGIAYPPKLVFSTAYRLATGSLLDHNDFSGGQGTPAFRVMNAEGIEIVKKEKDARRVWLMSAGVGKGQWENWQRLGEISVSFSKHPRDFRDFGSHEEVLAWLESRVSDRRPTNQALGMWEFGHEMQVGDHVLVKAGNHEWLGHGEVASDYWYDPDLEVHPHRRKVVWVKTGSWQRESIHPSKVLTEITHYRDADTGRPSWREHLRDMYEGQDPPRHWLLQGNPKHYNFHAALEGGNLDRLSVSQYREEVRAGDLAILWLTGRNGGGSALITVTGDPTDRDANGDLWLPEGSRTEYKAEVRIDRDLRRNPLSQERAEKEPLLAPLFPFNQSTNFEISAGQFELMKTMATGDDSESAMVDEEALAIELDRFLSQVMLGSLQESGYPEQIGEVAVHVGFKDGLAPLVPWLALTRLGLKVEDGAHPVLYYFRGMQRVILAYGVSDGGGAMTWPKSLLRDSISICDAYPQAPGSIKSNIRREYAMLEGVSPIRFAQDGSGEALTTQDLAGDFAALLQDYWSLTADGNEVAEPKIEYQVESKKTMATNTILFGPPGTGKTYAFQKRFQGKYQSERRLSRAEWLEQIVFKVKWRHVIMVALLERGPSTMADLLEHELIVAKGNVASSKVPRDTITTTLLEHVSLDCKETAVRSRREPYCFWLDKSSGTSVYSIDAESREVAEAEVEYLRTELTDELPVDYGVQKRWEFVTFHQSFSYEDFVEGIKPVLDSEEGGLEYEIVDGVFKSLCTEASRHPNERYAIFIDEINRGNVASIFGELITLIEPDKRLGGKHQTRVLLPYSKEEFGVPSNLDIYGTMNTADRSVEALDTALRRRFTFEEIGPDPSLLRDTTIEGVELEPLLKTINARVEHLLDRDHCIGHSYFLSLREGGTLDELRAVFARGILPLLQEYFYGDLGKIGLVLGSAFVRVKDSREVNFASDFDHEDKELLLEKEVYELSDCLKLGADAFRAIYK